MNPAFSARSALRTATAAHHDRVDAVFSRADLTNRDHYARFLQAQAGAYLPVEAALARAGAAGLVPDWEARRRASRLLADLAALGVGAPVEDVDIAFADDAAVLGGVYVLEGSRLGGAMLARGVPADFPKSFLTPDQSANWRHLLDLLELKVISAAERSSAVEFGVSCVHALRKQRATLSEGGLSGRKRTGRSDQLRSRADPYPRRDPADRLSARADRRLDGRAGIGATSPTSSASRPSELIGRRWRDLSSARVIHDLRNRTAMLRGADAVERMFGCEIVPEARSPSMSRSICPAGRS